MPSSTFPEQLLIEETVYHGRSQWVFDDALNDGQFFNCCHNFDDVRVALHTLMLWTFCFEGIGDESMIHFVGDGDDLYRAFLKIRCTYRASTLWDVFRNVAGVDGSMGSPRPIFMHVYFYSAISSEGCRFFLLLAFDKTLGYPGEGPTSSWSMASINVGSLQKQAHVLAASYDCMCIQETRITATTRRSIEFEAAKHDKAIHCGAMMNYASGTPEYGGVAITTHHGCARA